MSSPGNPEPTPIPPTLKTKAFVPLEEWKQHQFSCRGTAAQ